MNAQQLYDEIKDALDYFGLRFHEMHLMEFETLLDGVRFTYENRALFVPVK